MVGEGPSDDGATSKASKGFETARRTKKPLETAQTCSNPHYPLCGNLRKIPFGMSAVNRISKCPGGPSHDMFAKSGIETGAGFATPIQTRAACGLKMPRVIGSLAQARVCITACNQPNPTNQTRRAIISATYQSLIVAVVFARACTSLQAKPYKTLDPVVGSHIGTRREEGYGTKKQKKRF